MEVARIPVRRDTNRVKKDLKALCDEAIQYGASDARILNAREIAASRLAQQRKGTMVSAEEESIHWPEPLYPKDSLEEAMSCYRWAIVFRVDPDKEDQEEKKPLLRDSVLWKAHEKVFRIASMIESSCFYRGYHLAIGLAATNCRDVFCFGERRCWAMIKGKPCIYPFKARPALEACGLDPQVLAKRAGWDTSSVSTSKGLSNQEFLAGLVLVT